MALRWRVFLFFALGYFVSYLFRGVNIGFADPISAELSLSATQLGSLTGVYFLAFSLVQVPAGVALDLWGPRRVNAGMMLVAAVGTVVFGLAHSVGGLLLGRALIGIGVAVCLGATLKALAQAFPMARLPFMNGLVMAIGGMGGVVVGTPLTALMTVADWREVSVGLAGLTLLVAAAILWGTKPRAGEVAPDPGPRPTGNPLHGTWSLLRSASFWKIVSLPVLTGGAFYAVQSLWVGPYLRDVAGLSAGAAAGLVSVLGLAMMAGNIGLGSAARRVERAGISLYAFCGLGMVLFLVVQALLVVRLPLPETLLWVLYGVFGSSSILSYAVLAERYPYDMLGRVNTTVTLLMFLMIFVCQAGVGWVLDFWTPVAGAYPAVAHQTAWGLLVLLQVLGAVWYLWPARAVASAHSRAE